MAVPWEWISIADWGPFGRREFSGCGTGASHLQGVDGLFDDFAGEGGGKIGLGFVEGVEGVGEQGNAEVGEGFNPWAGRSSLNWTILAPSSDSKGLRASGICPVGSSQIARW